MGRGAFDRIVVPEGWFADRPGVVTAASWFDGEFIEATALVARGASTFTGMTGTGTATLSISGAGAATFTGMTGAGVFNISDAARGDATFDGMTGTGHIGIGSSTPLGQITVTPRIDTVEVTVRCTGSVVVTSRS